MTSKDGPIPAEWASRIWQVLKDEVGARGHEHFVRVLGDGCQEFRFQGGLGFGGKFWNANNRWYITCYREDEDSERLEAIRRADARLAELRLEYLGSLQ